MKRFVVAALIGLLVILGCDRGGNTGGTPRSAGEPGAKDTGRKGPSSDPSAPEGAPGGSNRGTKPNR
jgi:hypothetical protein